MGTEVAADLEKSLLELSSKEEELSTWKHELEAKEKMIEDLKASNAEKSAELDKLRGETQDSCREAREPQDGVSQALTERDRALMQVEVERQVAQHAKEQLEEERIAYGKLREEKTRRGVALVRAHERITYLESPAYQKESVEEYRQGLIGRAEVTLACKAGFDYLRDQLPAEMRSDASRFHYHPRIAGCLEVLEDIERQGETLNLDEEDEEDEAPVERIEKGNEGSTSRPTGDGGLETQSTSPHPITSELPLTPGEDMDLSWSSFSR